MGFKNQVGNALPLLNFNSWSAYSLPSQLVTRYAYMSAFLPMKTISSTELRADTCASLDEATATSVPKARQAIDQLGDALFA